MDTYTKCMYNMTTVKLYILITVHSFRYVTYLNECTVIYVYIYIHIHIFYTVDFMSDV